MLSIQREKNFKFNLFGRRWTVQHVSGFWFFISRRSSFPSFLIRSFFLFDFYFLSSVRGEFSWTFIVRWYNILWSNKFECIFIICSLFVYLQLLLNIRNNWVDVLKSIFGRNKTQKYSVRNMLFVSSVLMIVCSNAKENINSSISVTCYFNPI